MAKRALCLCGCGYPTGQPNGFLPGHASRTDRAGHVADVLPTATGSSTNRSTRFVCLRALLGPLGFRDASNATHDRLTACDGDLGITVLADGIEVSTVDPHTRGVVSLKIQGDWSYGSVHALILHLLMIRTVKGS